MRPVTDLCNMMWDGLSVGVRVCVVQVLQGRGSDHEAGYGGGRARELPTHHQVVGRGVAVGHVTGSRRHTYNWNYLCQHSGIFINFI
jgi:hypothetical protein